MSTASSHPVSHADVSTAEPPLAARIASSSRTISLATAASRILGFVRDLLIAQLFGTGAQAQAFVVAFRLPNLLRDLVGEGAMTSAIVPVLSATKATRSPQAFWRLVQASCVKVTLVACLLGGAGVAAAPWLVRAIAPGFAGDPEKFALTVRLTRLLFPFITLVGLWAFLGGLLNSFHSFAMPAMGPVALNLMMIGGCLWVAPRVDPPVLGLAWAVLLGGGVQLAMLVPLAARAGFRWRWVWRDPGAQEMTRLLAPRLIGTAVYQASVLFDTILASLAIAGPGAVAALYFANRLVQLPLALFATASAQASLPMLSERAAVKDLATFRATMLSVLRMVLFESLPAAVGLLVLAGPIIQVCFQRGAFDRYSTLMTAQVLGCFALGLLAYAANKVLTSAFYAMKDTRTPVRLAAQALGVNVVLACGFLWPLHAAGLALATALSNSLNSWRLMRALERRLGAPLLSELLPPLSRMGSAALLMGLACWSAWRGLDGRAAPAVGLSLVIGIGMLVYGAACRLLRVEEASSILRWLTRLRSRRPSVTV